MTHVLTRWIEKRLRKGKKSVLLLGARQVGKSTLVRSLAPSWTLNLADEAEMLRYAKDPARIRREVSALKTPGLIVIDEIQRVPALLNTLQALMDEGTSHRFVLTGSSARKLRHGGANLLPGRVILEHLDPLGAAELGDHFDLERVLRTGSLPGIFLDEESGTEVLETYVATYLREEIQAEALTRDIGSYARFLDVAAAESNRWINYSKLASDTEIAKETLRRFYQILEDTLLAFRLPAFSPKKGLRRVSQRDRFLLFDIGVRNAILQIHRGVWTPEQLGDVFEQWLILQCFYFQRAHKQPWTLSSYRTEAGAEVDLVIETPSKIVGIEIKSGANVRAEQLSGLHSLASLAHKPFHGHVVYRGERAQLLAPGIDATPYLSFLLETLPSLVE
jgi:uncharacterized protein